MLSAETRKWAAPREVWVAAALGAHVGWGAYPVLARYLQTRSHLPSMSLLALGNSLVMVLMLVLAFPRLDKRVFLQPVLWVFALVVVSRSITNMLAARFTLAIYVQLITLLTPFVVALLNRLVFRDVMPRYTGRAMTLALFGALLMMSGKVGQGGASLALTSSDFLGIGLALAGTLFLALYMLLVRRTAQREVPAEAVFIVQLVTIVTVTSLISAAVGEDWTRWREIGPADWAVFAAYSGGVFLAANVLQISALRHLGAPMVSSLLATRLVSALVIAAFLLGERLTTVWQGVGAVIVLVTITWYLWQQRE